MNEKRKPLWPKIVATVIVVPALYVASFGPACWLVGHGHLGESGAYRLYAPLISVASKSGDPIKNALKWYGGLWSETGCRLFWYAYYLSG